MCQKVLFEVALVGKILVTKSALHFSHPDDMSRVRIRVPQVRSPNRNNSKESCKKLYIDFIF